MIQVENHKGTFVPRCICDICNEPIKDAWMAMVSFPDDSRENGGEGEAIKTIFAHKGACLDRSEATHGDGGGTMELSTYLSYLLRNIGLDEAGVARAMGISRLMGEL